MDGNVQYHLGILVQNDEYEEFGELHLDPELQEKWKSSSHNGKIVECRYDHDWPNFWRFSRYRDDKLTANHISVYKRIMESIEDNVTKQEVIAYLQKS